MGAELLSILVSIDHPPGNCDFRSFGARSTPDHKSASFPTLSLIVFSENSYVEPPSPVMNPSKMMPSLGSWSVVNAITFLRQFVLLIPKVSPKTKNVISPSLKL